MFLFLDKEQFLTYRKYESVFAREIMPMNSFAEMDYLGKNENVRIAMLINDNDNSLLAFARVHLISPGVVNITDVFVVSNQRNKGFCKRLMLKIINTLDNLLIKRVYLSVLPTNLPAIRCYLSTGFDNIDPENSDDAEIGRLLTNFFAKFTSVKLRHMKLKY